MELYINHVWFLRHVAYICYSNAKITAPMKRHSGTTCISIFTSFSPFFCHYVFTMITQQSEIFKVDLNLGSSN